MFKFVTITAYEISGLIFDLTVQGDYMVSTNRVVVMLATVGSSSCIITLNGPRFIKTRITFRIA